MSSRPVYQVEVITDLVYAQGLRRSSWTATDAQVIDLTLDIYLPAATAEKLRPAMILLHGGGFQGGAADLPTTVANAEYFSARGWVVFAVNYRLGDDFGNVPPGWPSEPGAIVYPAGRDVKAAVRWLHANVGQYGVSQNHITAFGGSAGAMLALMLGISDGSDYRDEIDVVTDSTLASTYMSAPADVQTVVAFWGDSRLIDALEAYDGRNRYDAQDAPTLIVHGTDDTTVPMFLGERIYHELARSDVVVEFLTLIGEGHSAWDARLPDGRTITDAAFDFIISQQNLELGD